MNRFVYLYGVDSSQLPSMDDGLVARIEKSKNLLDTLLAVPFSKRDWTRISSVCEIITHNTKLLNGGV